MSYKTKLLLSKNDGDWRRRSAIIFKCSSTLSFNEFIKQCGKRIYPSENIKNLNKCKLFDIQQGLIPIDDEPNTKISELHEEGELYRNCQILVVLPSQSIKNPSHKQKIELIQEQELYQYLSSSTNNSTQGSISSHSIGYPSNHSSQPQFKNLSSIKSLQLLNV